MMKVRFLGFTLDAEAGRLSGPEGEVRLRPQAYRMLEVLVESAPRILSQEDLLDRVWGVEHLSPASVKQAISEVRQALGDDPARPRIIETVHRRGYRFIAALSPADEPREPGAPLEAPAPAVAVLRVPPEGEEAPLKDAAAEPGPVAEAAPLSPRSRRRFFLLHAAGLAGFAAVSLLEGSMPPSAARSVAPPARAARADHAAGRPTLAILGFRNLSERPEDGWISAALSEILRFELTTPGTVRLIPADNVVRMQRELGVAEGAVADAGLARIGDNLGTRLVVVGSYLVSPAAEGAGGPRVRIQVMVEDVRSGETVAWARQTGDVGDLLDLSQAAARGLLGSLGYDPGGPSGEAAALAANGESLRLWAEAMSRLRVRDAVGAISRLEKARQTDPDNPFVDDALAVAWSRLGFDSRAAEAAGRALSRAGGLPEEIRWVLTARAHEMRFELAEAERLYEKLWNRWSDNLDYGLSLAAAQRQSGAPEVSFTTVAELRKLAAPDGQDPRIDLAESDAAWGVGDFPRCRDAAERAIRKGGGTASHPAGRGSSCARSRSSGRSATRRGPPSPSRISRASGRRKATRRGRGRISKRRSGSAAASPTPTARRRCSAGSRRSSSKNDISTGRARTSKRRWA